MAKQTLVSFIFVGTFKLKFSSCFWENTNIEPSGKIPSASRIPRTPCLRPSESSTKDENPQK